MRKFLILALFVLGMYNVYACPDCEAPALDAAQEIILTEVYNIMPLDDPENDIHEGTPDPNRFYASIDGNLLFVGAYTDAPAYVEVINQDTGEVVVEEYFEGEAEVIIEQTAGILSKSILRILQLLEILRYNNFFKKFNLCNQYIFHTFAEKYTNTMKLIK